MILLEVLHQLSRRTFGEALTVVCRFLFGLIIDLNVRSDKRSVFGKFICMNTAVNELINEACINDILHSVT